MDSLQESAICRWAAEGSVNRISMPLKGQKSKYSNCKHGGCLHIARRELSAMKFLPIVGSLPGKVRYSIRQAPDFASFPVVCLLFDESIDLNIAVGEHGHYGESVVFFPAALDHCHERAVVDSGDILVIIGMAVPLEYGHHITGGFE